MANKQFKSFQKEWRKEQEEFKREIIREKKTLARFLIQMIVKFTPVLHGPLVSGWNLGINRQDTAIHQLSTSKGVTRRRLLAKVKLIKFNSTVFLTNEVPYAQLIEDDIHNNPARSMMVAKTISAVRAKYGKRVKITNVG